MPLVLHDKSQVWGELFLWHTEESNNYFETELLEAGLDFSHLRKWHPTRQKEWLSGRYLIHKYVNQEVCELTVDEHGKPGWEDQKMSISISHSHELVGLQVHKIDHGLDIQKKTDKVERVAQKFCNTTDIAIMQRYVHQSQYEHYIWGLKEAVYKAYGKKGLSYKNDITVTSMAPKGKIYVVTVELRRGDLAKDYQGKLSRIGPYFIAQVLEI